MELAAKMEFINCITDQVNFKRVFHYFSTCKEMDSKITVYMGLQVHKLAFITPVIVPILISGTRKMILSSRTKSLPYYFQYAANFSWYLQNCSLN